MRVLLTGGEGTIGRVLRDRLPFELTPFDLPACDARDYGQLLAAVQGHDAIVHLAWDVTENHLHNAVEPDNVVMTDNVYRAAREAGVPRVVMASSVHADAYHDADPARPLDPFALPIPDGPYGAKGIGEMATNGQPPAIAAAVFDAIGVWVTELPITPERVLRALERKEAGTDAARRQGKVVAFDEELSVNTVSSGGIRFEVGPQGG